MDLLYLEEHTHCGNYTFEGNSSFRHFKFDAAKEFGFGTKAEYMFLFILQGSINLKNDYGEVYKASENEMLSLGYRLNYAGKCLTETELILIVFDRPQVRCDEFSFIRLKKYLPEKKNSFRTLPIHPPIRSFLGNIIFYLDNKMYCRHLQDIKQSEWFFLMRAFYTKEENAMFFAPLIEERNNFILLVEEKAPKTLSVQELAEACNMTTKTFTRNFKKHFDTTPKKWMQLQKKQTVKLELIQSKDNLKVISGQLGFASSSHLGAYCRKYLQQSPKDVKNKM